MILSLAEAKEWLRIDGNEEDLSIQMLINGAEYKLKEGTGVTYDSTNDLAKIFCLKCIVDWYENRLPVNVIDHMGISMITILTYGSGSVTV